MAGRKRTSALILGESEGDALARTLGATVRLGRQRRRLTQRALGGLVGLSQSQISAIERGLAAHLPLRSWLALGLALGTPFAASFSRPRPGEAAVADAGHLELQEMMLRKAAELGWSARFEVATRPSDPTRSIDVLVRDDRQRRLLILECWNRFGDLGAAARSSARKQAEADQLAVAIAGNGSPYTVHLCWLVRPTAENRTLVRTYPHVFRAHCPGSSLAWCRALIAGTTPPSGSGLVWADPTSSQLVPVRLQPRSAARS
jgi:transcriptional regulator with XRE-family HTH domain